MVGRMGVPGVNSGGDKGNLAHAVGAQLPALTHVGRAAADTRDAQGGFCRPYHAAVGRRSGQYDGFPAHPAVVGLTAKGVCDLAVVGCGVGGSGGGGNHGGSVWRVWEQCSTSGALPQPLQGSPGEPPKKPPQEPEVLAKSLHPAFKDLFREIVGGRGESAALGANIELCIKLVPVVKTHCFKGYAATWGNHVMWTRCSG